LTEDIEIRLEAFDWLKNQANYFGDIIPRKLLQTGFEFRSQKIRLVSPQGIFKLKNCSLPISITTTPKQINILRKSPKHSVWQRNYWEWILRD